jgi:hypothetical protein
MSQALTFVLQGRDALSPAVRSAMGSIDSLIRKARQLHAAFQQGGGMGGVLKGLQGHLAGVGSAASSAFGALVGAANRALSMVGALFGNLLSTVLNVAGRIVSAFTAAFASLVREAGKLGMGLAAGIAAAAAAFGTLGIHSNEFRENTMLSLSAMLKSKEAAKDLFGWLEKFSDVKPFKTDEIVSAGKGLMAFGLDVKTNMLIAADVAFAMGRPLETVVSVLGRAKSGMIEMRELAEVGLTRQDVMHHGVKLDFNGQVKDRSTVLPAVQAALKDRFGGATSESASSMQGVTTTFISLISRVARQATELLFGSLKNGLTKLNEALNSVLGNGSLLKALAVPFTLIGKAIEAAAAYLPRFAGWLAKVATEGNVLGALASVAGLIKTIGDALKAMFSAVSGGKSFSSIWDAFKAAAVTALDLALRSWNALVAAIQYLVAHSGEIWTLIVQGINLAIAGVQTLVGAVVVLGGLKLAGIVGEVLKLGAQILKVLGWAGRLTGIVGTGGGTGAVGVAGAVGTGVAVGTAALAVGTIVESFHLKDVEGFVKEVRSRKDLSPAEKQALIHKKLYEETAGPNASWLTKGVHAIGDTFLGGKRAYEKKLTPEEERLVAQTFARDEQRKEKNAPGATAGTPPAPDMHRADRAGSSQPPDMHAGAQIGVDVPRLGGPLGWLQQLGAAAMGGAGGVATDALGRMPDALKNLLQGTQAAAQQGFNSGGLAPFMAAWAKNSDGVKRFLQGVMGPSQPGGAGDSGMPGSEILSGKGGAAAGGANPADSMDAEQIKQIIETRTAWMDAQIAAAKAMAKAPFAGLFVSAAEKPFAEAEQAAAEARDIIPVLEAKAKDITEQLKYVGREDAKYWELIKEQYALREQVDDLRQKEAETGVAAANKEQQDGLDTAKATTELLQAQLANNPFLSHNSHASRAFKTAQIVPAMIEQFRRLVNLHPEGESEADRIKRLTEAEGLKGKILEESGVGKGAQGVTLEGVMQARDAINKMWWQMRSGRGMRPVGLPAGFDPNTGMMGLFDQKKARKVLDQLHGIEKDAAVNAQDATIHATGQVVINAPGGITGSVGPARSQGGAPAVVIVNSGRGGEQVREALNRQGVSRQDVEAIMRSYLTAMSREAAPGTGY